MSQYEFRDGVPYLKGPPMSAAEAMDENRPLPRLALYALGWTDAEIDAAEDAERSQHVNKIPKPSENSAGLSGESE